jgi:glycosyltransferase involved in cell wall biosynthesis
LIEKLPKITAALIVRDEAAVLGGCLESLRGHVDEIVAVDTGSVDETPQIAAAHGARVLHFEWIGDFAAARNFALDAATFDWILYIDADERLEVPTGSRLQDLIAAPGHAGFRLKFRPRVGYSPFDELRIFRSDPRIRFQGRIHEYVVSSLRRVCESDGLRIGLTDAAIQHIGYEDDQSRKHARNLPLLTRAVEDDPDRVYYWWHLGETHAAVGNYEEAKTALRTGIQAARRRNRPLGRVQSILTYHALARLFLNTGEPAKALGALDEGLDIRPGDPALTLLKGRVLVDLERYSDALGVLRKLPLEDPESFFDPDSAYDLRIFGEWAYDLIGLANFRAGQFEDAREAFLAAASRSPDGAHHRARAALAAARAKSKK